ncbi:hypothetical protein VTJ04DRAFT_7961 [Mycothermus thermophilus]|uniref:uncharacterized protein n=1 Tax=Humicola insolens TaxID=85995 RepID=UPI003742E429
MRPAGLSREALGLVYYYEVVHPKAYRFATDPNCAGSASLCPASTTAPASEQQPHDNFPTSNPPPELLTQL